MGGDGCIEQFLVKCMGCTSLLVLDMTVGARLWERCLKFSCSADFFEDRIATQALDHPFKVSAQAFVPFLTFSRSLVHALTCRCVELEFTEVACQQRQDVLSS